MSQSMVLPWNLKTYSGTGYLKLCSLEKQWVAPNRLVRANVICHCEDLQARQGGDQITFLGGGGGT